MPPTEAPQTRRHILEAAEELIRRRGMVATTTRAIAERAGCAEGTIYRHFPDKQTLLCEIVDADFPGFRDLILSLPDQVGAGSVRDTLEQVAVAAMEFSRRVIPLAAGPLSDYELLVQLRRHFDEANTGPTRVFNAMGAYLRAEQERGRLSSAVSPEHVARLLFGACFTQAFVEALVGEEARLGSDTEFAARTVSSLLAGIEPR
jgi:AcrR family transcriptional regulator